MVPIKYCYGRHVLVFEKIVGGLWKLDLEDVECTELNRLLWVLKRWECWDPCKLDFVQLVKFQRQGKTPSQPLMLFFESWPAGAEVSAVINKSPAPVNWKYCSLRQFMLVSWSWEMCCEKETTIIGVKFCGKYFYSSVLINWGSEQGKALSCAANGTW